jgi:type I restriction-modification system DNA methylase subunit
MALSWNEIRSRALNFSKEWDGAWNENADAKPFLIDFFEVFGISRRKVATFEHKVKKLDDHGGYIDLLWRGVILIEMKSRGKNLDKAFQQAKDYLPGLQDYELPKYILVSDFENFRLYDLDENTVHEFKLSELVNNVQNFGYLLGYQKKFYKEQDPANIKAAELMGKLHDRLNEIGYTGHPLEVYLVRILFCLFSEDTTIFEKQQFQDYIEQRTNIDGSDLAAKLQELFQVLNTPIEKRFRNLDEQLAAFPYVNGKLFEEILPVASFDSKMRQSLLNCCGIDWSKISPAIFGSMFQSVMDPEERRNLGAHYTSEKNILKLIKPLFLDELWTEFRNVRENKNRLEDFHKKLRSLKFLDPACGCGNFLVITYRELRLLELEILRTLHNTGQRVFDVSHIIQLNVDQFFGIEFKEFPARIAEVAMWLIDHQMNMIVSQEFGEYFIRLPLQKAADIRNEDALEIEWQSIVPQAELSYIIGNPPFSGSKIMKQCQRDQIVRLFTGIDGAGILDYVTGWYIKAAKYIQGTGIKVGFVSTNSIVQGEQVSILWGTMLNKYQIKIHFAHRTFKWSNEARGKAAVFCVIVGFANFDITNKAIYEYEDIKGEPHELKAKNINPYLVDAKDILIEKKSRPICSVPKLSFGNMPLDGGNLFLTEDEKNELVTRHPGAQTYLKRVFGSVEFLHDKKRWCIWLEKTEPSQLKEIPEIVNRIELVRKFRLNSVAPSTQKFASTPALFRDRRLPKKYVVVPKVSSERRKYIPLGFFTDEFIATDLLFIIPDCGLYHFGVLSSLMHMAWVNSVCGRLKSDYRYSKDIVYNNFPWPESPSEKQEKAIETAAQNVLHVRSAFSNSCLADLYDPLTMPPDLVKAHQVLDKAVDLAYRPQPFSSEANRMEFLFALYEKYTAGLFSAKYKMAK